jgi:hypothetical protein
LEKVFLKYAKNQDHQLDATEAHQFLMDFNCKDEVSQADIE